MSATQPKPVYRMPLSVRWRDLDSFQHVNNSNFLTYLEEARIRWFQTLDTEWVNDEFAPLLAAVHINYRQPVPYPAELVVALYVERVGTSSVTLAHRITSADGETLYSDGSVVMVWIDLKTQRPIVLPDSIREVASGHRPSEAP